MQAAIILQPNRIETQEVPIPEPEAGEVLIKVMASGICGRISIFSAENTWAATRSSLGTSFRV